MHRTLAVISSFAVAALVAGAAHLAAQEGRALSHIDSDAPSVRETSSTRGSETPADVELARLRLREGTRLRDVAGHFRQNGETLTFVDGESREITGLPNLNLERIIRMLKTVEEPEAIGWNVSGTITEFGGRNYLLISRAVYKAAAPPPAPESIDDGQLPAAAEKVPASRGPLAPEELK